MKRRIPNKLELWPPKFHECNCRGISWWIVLSFFRGSIVHFFSATWFAGGHQDLRSLFDLFLSLLHVVVFPCLVLNDETTTKVLYILLKHLQTVTRSHFWSSEGRPSFHLADNILLFECWCEILCTVPSRYSLHAQSHTTTFFYYQILTATPKILPLINSSVRLSGCTTRFIKLL